MKQITKDLNLLKEEDLITIILYCLYKFTKNPDYAAISELAYTVDKDSLYKLCATFGGCTIRIPTLNEYREIVKVMFIFDLMNSDGLSFNEACEKADVSDNEISTISEIYSIMSEVLDSYET